MYIHRYIHAHIGIPPFTLLYIYSVHCIHAYPYTHTYTYSYKYVHIPMYMHTAIHSHHKVHTLINQEMVHVGWWTDR